MPGPKRETAESLRLNGSWRAKERERMEVPKLDGLPAMPDDLADDAADRWREIFPMLDAMGILQPCDGPALARLCVLYADEREIRMEVATAGDPKRSDSLRRVLAKVVDQLRTLESEFGMTPASRMKVVTADRPTDDEADSFAAFLKADRA